jgi:hypothetical protein
MSPAATIHARAGKPVGAPLAARVLQLTPNTPYYVAIVGVDMFGNTSAPSFVQGTTVSNGSPYAEMQLLQDIVLPNHQADSFYFAVTDEEAHNWTIEVLNHVGKVNAVRTGDWEFKLIVYATAFTAGDHTVDLEIKDEWGEADIFTVPFSILPNHPPVAGDALADVFFNTIYLSKRINLYDYFDEPDGEKLQFTAQTLPPDFVKAEISAQGELALTALKAGKATVTITASDFFGASVGATFTVMSRNGTKEVDLYPNPVADILNIRMGEYVDGSINVKLYNAVGKLAFHTDVAIAPFAPASVDIGGLTGGAYSVVVTYKGNAIKGNIIKL